MPNKIIKAENVHSGHRQRNMTKLIEKGLDGFSEHEILEILLYYANKRIDTNPIAHRLINTFGSVKNVVDAPISELLKVEGVGKSTAEMIHFIHSFIQAYFQDSLKTGEFLGTPDLLKQYSRKLFTGIMNEQVRLIMLDRKNRFVSQVLINEGVIGAVEIDTRRIVELIIAKNCDTVVLVHNHPKGSELPSHNDKLATRNIFNMLQNIGVNLIDHIIVGMDGELSIRETGAMIDIWH